MRSGGVLSPTHQRGVALVAAVFLIVVLAGIGALAVRANMTQQQLPNLHLQDLRLRAVLNAGIQYAAARVLATGQCSRVASNLTLEGFDVDLDCDEDSFTVNGATVEVFTLTVSAGRGSYGSPDYVSRSSTARVTT